MCVKKKSNVGEEGNVQTFLVQKAERLAKSLISTEVGSIFTEDICLKQTASPALFISLETFQYQYKKQKTLPSAVTDICLFQYTFIATMIQLKKLLMCNYYHRSLHQAQYLEMIQRTLNVQASSENRISASDLCVWVLIEVCLVLVS